MPQAYRSTTERINQSWCFSFPGLGLARRHSLFGNQTPLWHACVENSSLACQRNLAEARQWQNCNIPHVADGSDSNTPQTRPEILPYLGVVPAADRPTGNPADRCRKSSQPEAGRPAALILWTVGERSARHAISSEKRSGHGDGDSTDGGWWRQRRMGILISSHIKTPAARRQ